MNYLQLLKDLVSLPSVDPERANEAIVFCQEWLSCHGIKSVINDDSGFKNLICEIGEGEKTLVINGHIDVVDGRPDQFKPYVASGMLFGRGAVDMKASVAAVMTILVELKDTSLPCKVQFQLVSDEESGGAHGSRYLVENGFVGNFVICGEPTHLGLGIQSKGVLQVDIEVLGLSAHASRPWEGRNAVTKAYDLYQYITKLPFTNARSIFYDCPTVNLARITGGDVYNKVPDYCKIGLDIRFLPGQDVHEIITQIESVTGKVKVALLGPSVETDPGNEYVVALAKTVRNKLGDVRLLGQHGTADTRHFFSRGIPALEFGPSGGNWHADGEYVELSSVDDYKDIIKAYILNFR